MGTIVEAVGVLLAIVGCVLWWRSDSQEKALLGMAAALVGFLLLLATLS